MANEKIENDVKLDDKASDGLTFTPNNSNFVSVGKGKVGGYCFSAALSSTLVIPTDASTALATDFGNDGYIGEDGITNTKETESTDFKDLNGDTVLTTIQSKKETFKFKLIETREEALKEVYGQSNVEVTPATGSVGEKIKVKSTSDELPRRCFVLELVLTGGAKMRKVLPNAKVTELGEEKYASGELVGYELTLTCSPDTNGVTAYTYIERPV